MTSLRMIFELALPAVLLTAVAFTLGPSAALGKMRDAWRELREFRGALIAAAIAFAVLLLATREAVDPRVPALYAITSTASFLGLWLLAMHFSDARTRLHETLLRIPIVWIALGFALTAAAIQYFLFGGVPHVNDELAYGFQAQALSTFQLSFSPPPHPEFFRYPLTMVEGGRWFGVMNPGWPAILALGVAAGVPQLVNPILGGLCLLTLHAFFLRAGFGANLARLATLYLAISPFFLFLSASSMAHTASLLCFAVVYVCAARMHEPGGSRFGLGAGLALGLGLCIRPLDAAVTALPLSLAMLARSRTEHRLLPRLAITALLAAAGLGVLLAYHAAITGDPLTTPTSHYFELRHPEGRFGLGFGDDMGTHAHGPEWPGYHLSDVPRVTGQRLLQLLRDVHSLPLIELAIWIAVGISLAKRSRAMVTSSSPSSSLSEGSFGRERWSQLLLASALCVLALYAAHFYHGIAYGARHYALLLPILVLASATLGGGRENVSNERAPAIRAGAIALLLHALVFAIPVTALEYGRAYRQASNGLRNAVRDAKLTNAIVFVDSANWGWKSAFPLNQYPLDTNNVLFALDRGDENFLLRKAFPGRMSWNVRRDETGHATLSALPRESSDVVHK